MKKAILGVWHCHPELLMILFMIQKKIRVGSLKLNAVIRKFIYINGYVRINNTQFMDQKWDLNLDVANII